jgi:hypothetical protein
MVTLYEKLGLFYLGRDVDRATQEATDSLTLLKNKNFTTHAAIIGMTGSGKTGLGIGLIEEAAIDNIPSILIDPKGDMGNLLLTDPNFDAKSFEPWVEDEANTKGEDVSKYAQKIATMWHEGIRRDYQDSDRVAKFSAIKKSIYTPGSSAGIGVNILGSLDAPPMEIINDADGFAAYLKSSVSSLLSLIGIQADPVSSKEYLLVAQILATAWTQGQDLSLEQLIGAIINPSFERIGVLPLESFYPQERRFALATKFNAIIASPTFATWLQGEPLDIQKLLYDEDGKAKIAIFSIAHLSDDERMFFVTLLLNKYLAWMRRQSGTSALKTILYMDEIYGFFPPSKNPPSKEPMMILLKQARAFGVGVVLSTQNPVDLDYKGLSNIGTWFIGRLQTAQDIDRVIDGLGGKVGGGYRRSEIKALLANLNKRTFFIKSSHLEDIRLFTTRWVMSYLKGPLKAMDITKLMKERKANTITPLVNQTTPKEPKQYLQPIQLDRSIEQRYRLDVTGKNNFRATLQAQIILHYYQQSKGIDEQEEHCLSLDIYEDEEYHWEDAQEIEGCQADTTTPPSNASFTPLPREISEDKGLKKNRKQLIDWLYRTQRLELYRSRSPRLSSEPYESLGDFKVRIQDILNEKKEKAIDKLQRRYEKREQTLLRRLERTKKKLEKEEADANSSLLDTGIAVLGALFGRTSSAKLTRAISKGTRAYKERGDIDRVQEQIDQIQEDLIQLSEELEDQIEDLASQYDLQNVEINSFLIKPKKSDIQIKNLALHWVI